MDETEPLQFFNKAMTYFETAMGCGDLVRIIFITLVSSTGLILYLRLA
jgi:hypothetical protein